MSVIDRLASSLGRRDELPNQELATEIASSNNKKAVKELVDNVVNSKAAVQSDCIKVLYEVGYVKPKLIAPHTATFLQLINHKNNRLQWGAMTALSCITREKPKEIYKHLPQIMQACDKGSVITRDSAVNILIQLAADTKYAKNAFPLLMEQLRGSPVNQLPMYAERSLPIINEKNKEEFLIVLKSRLDDVEKESKRKRIEKVIRKLS